MEHREDDIAASGGGGAPAAASAGSRLLPEMLARLNQLTGSTYEHYENDYRTFVSAAQLDAQNNEISDRLSDLHDALSREFVVGKIRAIDSWADGESAFRIVAKSWDSVIDKLYRINILENETPDSPPRLLSLDEKVRDVRMAGNDRWVTPDRVHEFMDDLLRTKFVVPFADGVVDVSARIRGAAEALGLPCLRRYHAKDSGYHAHHLYIVIPVTGRRGESTQVALEIKVLTKLQDTLGELTHLLYELKRTGNIKAEKKRKLAWIFDSPDFAASYVGHSAHYIEASMVNLKQQLERSTSVEDGVVDGGES